MTSQVCQENKERSLACQLLILMGDTSRYIAKGVESQEENAKLIERAHKCYEKAAKVFPFDGWAFNQMSIARALVRREDFLDRVYYQTRALMAPMPFT